MSGRQVTLVVSRSGKIVVREQLDLGTYKMGRSETNCFPLVDVSVSRYHARIIVEERRVTFEDLGSGNGSWFNGERVELVELQDGDEITIEPFSLSLEIQEAVIFDEDEATDAFSEETINDYEDKTVILSQEAATTLLGEDSVPWLVGVAKDGTDTQERYELVSDVLTMGRSEQRDVVLSDPAASRLHCEIVYHQGSHWLRDAGAANGLFLNGNRVKDQELRNGDLIRIGVTEFRYKSPKDEADPATSISPAMTSVTVPEVTDDKTMTEGFDNILGAPPSWDQPVPDPPTPNRPTSGQVASEPPPFEPLEFGSNTEQTGDLGSDLPPLENIPPSVNYGIAPDLGSAPDSGWSFGAASNTGTNGKLKVKKKSGDGLFANPIRGAIVVLVALIVLMVGGKVVYDSGMLSRGPAIVTAGTGEHYAGISTVSLSDVSRINALRSEGERFSEQGDYRGAIGKFLDILEIDDANDDAKKLYIYACADNMRNVLRSSISASAASESERAALREEAISMANEALQRRGLSRGRAAQEKVRAALEFFASDEELQSLSVDLGRMIRSAQASVRQSNLADQQSTMQGHIDAGDQFFRQRSYAQAISEYERAMSLDYAQDHVALYQVAEEGLGRASGARRSAAQRPYGEGVRLMRAGGEASLIQARDKFRESLRIFPEYAQAQAKLEEVMSSLLSSATVEYRNGQQARDRGDNERARGHYQRVITLIDDSSHSVYRHASRRLEEMGPG